MIPVGNPSQPQPSGTFTPSVWRDAEETGPWQHLAKSTRDSLIGRRVAQYVIEAPLGGGAMGVVYKAHDTKLHRKVALKFLPPQWSHDETAKQRFIREAQAASAADHRNICTIHDIDTTDDGELFIVMAYYEGQTLKQTLEGGPPPHPEHVKLALDRALDIAAQVSEGLAKAHAHGVVHRDVKPGNLMIADDSVKILDFGLAKFADSLQLTIDGSHIGTVAYMSPEQARCEEADVRSDVWAVGVVLYEMLAGHVPFEGRYAEATFHAIKHDQIPPLKEARPDIPEAVEALIHRALEKDPRKRFQTAADLARALRTLQGDLSSWHGAPGSGATSGSQRSGRIPLRPPSIAVVPFRNVSDEKGQDYFCDGLTEEFINALTKVRGLRVMARASVFQLKDQTPIRIGEALNVDTMLEGSVRKTGNRLRIVVALINTRDQSQVWQESFDRELKDIFAVQDEIAGTVVKTLRGKLATDDSTRPLVPHAANLEAYQAYLEGRYHWNKRTESELKKSARCFERAIALDREYAPGYVGLAEALVTLGTYGVLPPGGIAAKADEALKGALQIDDKLAEAYACRGCLHAYYNWSWSEAEDDFKRALELNPDCLAARHWYGINYLVPQRRFDEATEQLHRALDLDPLSLIIKTSLGMRSYFAGSYEQALHELSNAIELDESFVLAHVFMGHTYTALSKYEEASHEFDEAIRLSGRGPDVLAAVGYLRGVSSDAEGARSILAELRELSQRRYVSPTLLAQVYAGLDDKQEALNCLESAAAERAADLAWLAVRPVFAGLREEARFAALVKRLGLPS
jgi:serine/threonine-protein kinase